MRQPVVPETVGQDLGLHLLRFVMMAQVLPDETVVGFLTSLRAALAGLVGSILVRIQYYMLDAATRQVFSDAVTLTETRVTPALERQNHG